MSTSAPKKATTAGSKTPAKAKSTLKKVPTPKGVTASRAVKSTVKSEAPATAPKGLELKKQELIEKVVRLSEVKKKDAKPVVEAMLQVLGEALAEGRELNLKPLGKVKLNRTKEMPNARVIVAKIRQSKDDKNPGSGVKQTVATAAE